MSLIDGLRQLTDDALEYVEQITTSEPVSVEIVLTDVQENATLHIHNKITLQEGSHNPDARILMTKTVFNNILAGKADFGALIGRSKYSEKRPIDFDIINTTKTNQIMSTLYTLMTFFFTPGKPKIKKLNRSLAGEAHGAHPIPLVYGDGLRSGWYTIDEGETLNESGEKDPYPQVFVIIKGRGEAQIGDARVTLEPDSAVYIPVNASHSVTALETMQLLWLAWNTPIM